MKKYTFQMTKMEILELCLAMTREQQGFLNIRGLLIILAMLAVECFVLHESSPFIIGFLLLAAVMIFLLPIARNYFRINRLSYEKIHTLWIEDGMLKQNLQGIQYSEISCDSFTGVRRTRKLLILETKEKRMVWHSIPLRAFADEQERDRFVEAVMGSARKEAAGGTEEDQGKISPKDQGGQVYFKFFFPVGEEEWVRVMTDAAEVLQAKTLGNQEKGRIVWRSLVVVFELFLCWVWWKVPNRGEMAYIAVFIGIIFLILLVKSFEKPEKEIRRQASRGTAQDQCGDWEISITETGIGKSIQKISGKSLVMIPWENLSCMVETDTEFFFFLKDKKGFHVLLKEAIEGREQIESLKELCRKNQLEILAGKHKKYVPKWILSVLTGILIVGLIVDVYHLMDMNSRRNISSDGISLEEQIFVLRTFGFTIPNEMEETLQDYAKDSEMINYVEEYPYIWLLINLAWADDGEGYRDGPGVFWFDFEGWDISTNYIFVLEGMQRLSTGSILDGVENIQEDIEDMDWEKGTGIITISLEWKGQEYSWEMDVENDWIDPKVLGIYNSLLEKEDVPERFYVTGDGGQDAIVFYCTRDWAQSFGNITGLHLEAYVEEFNP